MNIARIGAYSPSFGIVTKAFLDKLPNTSVFRSDRVIRRKMAVAVPVIGVCNGVTLDIREGGAGYKLTYSDGSEEIFDKLLPACRQAVRKATVLPENTDINQVLQKCLSKDFEIGVKGNNELWDKVLKPFSDTYGVNLG